MAVITFVKVFYFRVPKERDIALLWYLSSKFLWEWDLKPQEDPFVRCAGRGGKGTAVITHDKPNITARQPREHCLRNPRAEGSISFIFAAYV